MTSRLKKFRHNFPFVHPPGMETVPSDFEPGWIQIFDNGLLPPGSGELGPSHYGRIREPEYAYALEVLFEELVEDHPEAVRAVAPDGRVWTKTDGRFVFVVN